MPIAKFELPDGRVARFEVPEGTTPEQAQQMIAPMIGGITAGEQKETPGIFSQIVGLPAEVAKGFVRGITTDPASGIASLGYTGARAAGYEGPRFEETGFGRALGKAQTALAPSDEGVITQFGSGLGSLASFIPGGLLKGGIGLAAKLTQAGAVGSEEARARAEQARLEGQADATAGQQLLSQLGGTGVGFTELAPLERLAGPIRQVLRGVPASKADEIAPGLFNTAKRMLVTGGIEGLQEGMANVAQDLIAKGIYNPNLEIGESALGDAALGASVGAFAQGAIDLVTRGKRTQIYNQLRQQEEAKRQQEEEQKAAEQRELQRQQTLKNFNIQDRVDEKTGLPILALPAPSGQVDPQKTSDPFFDPLNVRFTAEDIGKDAVGEVNKARAERGLPKLNQFTVEDLLETGDSQDTVSLLLSRKLGYDGSQEVTADDILTAAKQKNISTNDTGFRDFMKRTTGGTALGRMSQPQLFALQKAIDAIPAFEQTTSLPVGTNAKLFDDSTYSKTIDGLKSSGVLKDGTPVGKAQVIKDIKDYSGLVEDKDAERLLQTALNRGDLESSVTKGTEGTSINIKLPSALAPGIGGPDVRKGDYREEKTVGYEVRSADGSFTTVVDNLTEAERLREIQRNRRAQSVGKLSDELTKATDQIDAAQAKLDELASIGEEGTPTFKRIQENVAKLQSKADKLKERIVSNGQDLDIVAKKKPVSRQGYTLFENNVPVGTFTTEEEAQRAAVRNLTDEQLEGIINNAPVSDVTGAVETPSGAEALTRTPAKKTAMVRRVYDEAVAEKERRYRSAMGLPPPAAPIQIKITGDAVAAAERLRAAGLTVRFAPEVVKEVPEINKRLQAILDKLGLKDVRLKLVESMKVPGFAVYDTNGDMKGFLIRPKEGTKEFAETMARVTALQQAGYAVKEDVASANGSYAAKLIQIALDSENPIRATRHEALHALKELGFFTPQQWAVLERKAKSEWMKKYNIEGRYSSLDEEGQLEEAIADAFSDFDQTQPPPGMIGALFRKIKAFFEALGNAFRGSGFQTASDVFTRVNEGGLTPGAAGVSAQPKYSLEASKRILEARRAMAGEFNQIDPPQSLIDLYRRVLEADERVNVGGYSRAKTAATKLSNRLNREMEAFASQALGREINYNDIGKLTSRLSQFVDPEFIGETKYSLNAPEFEQTANVTPLGVQQARIYEKELESLIKKIGDRIVGMKSGETLDNVRKAVKKLQNYTAQGLKGKDWYENSAKAVLEAFNGDPVLAEKFFQIIAITSANTEVAANFTKASKAWTQFASGEPIKVGTENENKKINALLNFGEDWEGRKTNTFYTNLMEAMEGKDSGRSTIDLHMTRMLFDRDAPTEAQYILAENMVRLLASKIGLPARQIQAASWVTQKAKTIFDEYRKKGWKKNLNDDQLREFAFERAVADYSHLMKARVRELPVTDALKELSSNIRSRVQNITGEVIPSTQTEMAEVEDLAFKDKEKLTKQIAKSKTVENIAKAIGIESKVRVTVGSGAYEGRVNPNLIVQVVNDDPVIAQQDALDLANAMSYVFKQDATPFFRADPAMVGQEQLGYRFKFASPLTPAQQKKILSVLNNKFGKDAGFTKVRANEIVTINYRGEDGTPFLVNDTDFVIGLDEIRNDIDAISPIESQEVFGAQSEYPYHDWKAEPTGVGIVQGIQTRRPERPNIQRGLNNLRESFVGDVRQAVRETGREPKFSLRLDELIGGSGLGDGISIRDRQPTAQSFDAVHYGKQPVSTLAGSMYGTGIRGAEAQRVFSAPDQRIRRRAYFYIPFQNGIMPIPEAGLGNYVHVQRLNNLLGPGPEAEALVRAARASGQFDENAFESSVIDAGYDGYAVPDMGMAVVLGADVPVIQRGTRQEVFERPADRSITIGNQKYSLRQTDTPEFKKWFGKSTISTLRGYPKVMYHGTARDISEFRPKQANAIFVTDDPDFAENFSDTSEDYMVNFFIADNKVPRDNELLLKIEDQAIENALKDGAITPAGVKKIRKLPFFEWEKTEIGDYVRNAIKDNLPTRANIMPLFVRAENPFDYQNDDTVKQLMAEIETVPEFQFFEMANIEDVDNFLELYDAISRGSWRAIENPVVQTFIKDAGFDSFYVKEGGVKNLAVYSPNQVKSAIGNIGTFARDNDDIRYSLALDGLQPQSRLIPNEGGNPDGNLGIAPSILESRPIRLLIGTHDDIEDKGFGAKHILSRIKSDPRRAPVMGTEELLERVVKEAQRTAQTYTRIYEDKGNFILYNGRNSLILSRDKDSLSIVTMYKQDTPDRKYGNPIWQGRAPSVAEFLAPVRGMEVEALDTDIIPKPAAVTRKRNVYTPGSIADLAAEVRTVKPGKISLKKYPEKFSLAIPKESVRDFFDVAGELPTSESVDIIRSNWIGGVSGVGERDLAYDLPNVEGGQEYTDLVQQTVRENLGESFKGYRLMSKEEFEELKAGAAGTQLASITLDPDFALAFARIPRYAKIPKGDLVVAEMDITPEHVQMIGSPTESELVIDYGVGYNPDEVVGYASPVKYSIADNLKPVDTNSKNFKDWFMGSVVTNPDGSPKVMYHGTQADVAFFDLDAETKNRTGNPVGFYFTPLPEEASGYANRDIFNQKTEVIEGANVIPVYLSILNPFNYTGDKKFGKTPITRKMFEQFEKELRSEYSLPEDWMQGKLDLFKERAQRGGDPFPVGVLSSEAKTRVLQAGGYDGMIDGRHLVAFKPGQIKSAITTTGKFDKAFPDIRYSLDTLPIDPEIRKRIKETTFARSEKNLSERMTAAFNDRERTYIKLRQAFLNKYEAIERLTKKIADRLGNVELMADTSAIAAALMSDRAAGFTAATFGSQGRKGGIPIYKNGGYTIDQSVNGLVEALAPLAKLGQDIGVGPEIYRMFQYYAGARRGKRLLAEVDPKTGKVGVREKLFDRKDVDNANELERKYPVFKTVFDNYQKYNKGLVDFMKATGVISDREAQLWTENWDYIPFYRQLNGEDGGITGPKVFSSISGVSKPHKLEGSKEELTDFLESVTRNARAAVEAGMKNVASQRVVRDVLRANLGEMVPKGTTGADIVTFKDKGQTKYVRVADPLLVEALKGLDMPQIPFLSILSKPADVLRNLVTKDPGFMIANLARDSLQSWITSGVPMTPLVDTYKQATMGIVGGSPAMQALFQSGFFGGYDYTGDVQAGASQLAKEIRKVAKTQTTGEKVNAMTIGGIWDLLDRGSQASDLATRAEVYKRVLEQTGNETEAMFQAMEVLNFSRKGNSTAIRFLTAIIPFFNARIQGLDVLYRAGFGKMASQSREVQQKAFIYRSLTMLALSAMYWAVVHDDDDYLELSQEERDNNWLVNGVKIPIPFELGVIFKVLPERIANYYAGQDTGSDVWNSFKRNIGSTLNTNFFIPQAVLPLVEVSMNSSMFTGNPIVGMQYEGVRPAEQIAPGTSKSAIGIAESINAALTAAGAPSSSKVSPIQIDYLIRGYTGTLGQYASSLLDTILQKEGDPVKASLKLEQMPVFKRFLASPEGRGPVDDYYSFKKEVDMAARTANFLTERLDYEGLVEFYKGDGAKLIAMKPYINQLDKEMKGLRDFRSVVLSSRDMSADDKADTLKAIRQAENAITGRIRYLRKELSQQ